MPDTVRIRVADRVTLSADELSVTLTDVELAVRMDGDVIRGARLHGSADQRTWSDIDRARLFHLDPEVRGPCLVDLNAADTVRIEARCDDAVLTAAVLHAEDEYDLAAMLRFGKPVDALQRQDAWYALYVKTPTGPDLSEGFATSWASQP